MKFSKQYKQQNNNELMKETKIGVFLVWFKNSQQWWTGLAKDNQSINQSIDIAMALGAVFLLDVCGERGPRMTREGVQRSIIDHWS